MKKRILLLVMSVSFLMLMGGCGKKNAAKNNTEDKNTESDDKDAEGTADKTEDGTDSGLINVTKEDYKVSDYIKLGEYKGIKYTVNKLEVTDADIETAIQEDLQAAATEQEIKDRDVVKDGDIVNIDYEGLKDGVAFDGGTAKDSDLVIGSGSFIPGFEDGLIGATVGKQVDIKTTFPEDYQSTELAGQEVVFKVTVNAIKEKVVPELTEDYVKENLKFDTIDAYKEDIRKKLQEENEATMKSEKIKNVFQTVVDNSEFKSYPQTLLDFYKAEFKNMYIQYASYFGLDFAGFIEGSGITEEEFDEEASSYAESMAKQELVLNSIIKTEKLDISEDEYQKGVEKLAADYGYETKEDFLNTAEEEQIRETLLWEKAINTMLDTAVEI
ncbi:MAG: trigger factor [Lachnospiraceae bacterium]|jgi:trigger factor|nr:trigger factor [Lachnospiraceae bacterium]